MFLNYREKVRLKEIYDKILPELEGLSEQCVAIAEQANQQMRLIIKPPLLSDNPKELAVRMQDERYPKKTMCNDYSLEQAIIAQDKLEYLLEKISAFRLKLDRLTKCLNNLNIYHLRFLDTACPLKLNFNFSTRKRECLAKIYLFENSMKVLENSMADYITGKCYKKAKR